MLKKIYKNNGFIYISEKENNIKINNLFLKQFIKYKDTIPLKDIHNIVKKDFYKTLKPKNINNNIFV